MGPRKELKEMHIFKTSVKDNSKYKFVKNNQSKSSKTTLKKKQLGNIIKKEFDYISNLFDILDIAKLNHGRRNLSEDEEDENLEILDLPEKKSFKKTASKKASGASKSKSFPNSIEGLEKELEGLKGTTMTYQKKLRKKGLQTRLIKKKRKEELKQRKAALRQGKMRNTTINGPIKPIKPVLNSEGNVVLNRFDFADNESKKENKKKVGPAGAEVNINSGKKKISDVIKSDFTRENADFGTIIKKETKLGQNQGPVFNKDNKMVFSKVFVPENNMKIKKKIDKDPRKILQKIKGTNKKILELAKEDKEKAGFLQDKQKWTSALKRASGEKVKDDPELLKKSILKEKNKKMRSQKKWQARLDLVQKEKDEKQRKRTENIQARKNEKKKKKMKRAVKKGSYVQV